MALRCQNVVHLTLETIVTTKAMDYSTAAPNLTAIRESEDFASEVLYMYHLKIILY